MKFVYNEEKNEEMRRILMMQPTVLSLIHI